MVREWPQPERDHRTPIVRISDPAMEWHEINLNDSAGLLSARVVAASVVYPKRVAEGTMDDKKAEAEIAEMRVVVEFLVHCVFKAVTRNRGTGL